MGQRPKKRALTGSAVHAGSGPVVAHDRYWERELRSAVCFGALLFGALQLLDWRLVRPSPVHTAWWAGLGTLLVIVLVPPRVSTVAGELVVRGLLTRRRVRMDRLVAVRVLEGVSQRLLLSDVSGRRLVLDPRVLVANPRLWHRLDQGARRSLELGTLRCGMPVLERLGGRIDGEVCRAVLRASGLE